jgi:hypothetical protein
MAERGVSVDHSTLVQIAGSGEMLLINMDTLLIEQDSIRDGGRCGALEPESVEVDCPLRMRCISSIPLYPSLRSCPAETEESCR